MLNAFWNGFVVVLTLGSIFGCWWLLHWTRGISNPRDSGAGSTGHVWDENLVELNSPLPRWWLHLFNLTIVFALLYMLVYPGLGNVGGLLGWTQEKQYAAEVSAAEQSQQQVFARFRAMSPEQLVADPQAMESGRRLFANNCAMCHGSDGRGARGFPNLTDNDWQWGAGYEQVLTAIRLGRSGVMPPFGAVLGETGTQEVTAYVRALSGQDAMAAAPAAGKTHFDTLCSTCHGPDGKGNPLLGAPNLTDATWLYGGSAQELTTTVSAGRNGNMPSHASLLSDDRQRIVAAYVVSLSATRHD